ncbi:serine hydrolase domain-containing protein [Nocardiopsis eucommiae]|uniref:serine hydrolase domain-containing protein n=1 Tax=Nocardiopsis eucommiae TaxID=2831970 RepID=UPI003D7629FA
MTETPTRQSSAWADTALATMRAALDHMVEAGRTPGGVIAAGTVDTVGFSVSGTVTPSGPAAPEPSTMYDVASLTKVVATWPLVGDAVTRNLLDLDAPVAAYFPEFTAGAGMSVTVRQILTHTSGLMPSTRLDRYVGDHRDVAEAILSEPLDNQGAHRYINRGFILLGLLLARVNGRPLADLLDGFAGELGVSGLQYGPLPRSPSVAPTERRLVGGEPLHGVVHDENAHTLGGVAGHAGVFASAEALAALARRLLAVNGETGTWAEFVAESWSPVVRVDESTSRGLAWLLSKNGVVYHHGFTGTSLYLAPDTGRYLVLLTNAIAHGRDRVGLPELRRSAIGLFG